MPPRRYIAGVPSSFKGDWGRERQKIEPAGGRRPAHVAKLVTGSDAALAGGLRQRGWDRTGAMDKIDDVFVKERAKGATAAEL